MLKPRNIDQFRKMALLLPFQTGFDIADTLLTYDANRQRASYAAQVTAKQLSKFLVRPLKVVPEILEVLGNCEHWRMARLTDASTGKGRRPRVYLDAKIDRQGSVAISCRVVPMRTSVEADVAATDAIFSASDFLPSPEIRKFVNPGHDVIRLTADEYPARSKYTPEAGELYRREEVVRRHGFYAFLVMVVNTLRTVLDVRIVDWMEFDAQGHLVEVPFNQRVLRLANAEYTAAFRAMTASTKTYIAALATADIPQAEFEQALALCGESNARLNEAVSRVTGRSLDQGQVQACVAAKRALGVALLDHTECLAGLTAAMTAAGGAAKEGAAQPA